MAKFGVIVSLDGITNLGTLWEALQIKGLKVESIFPDTGDEEVPPSKETAVSVNGLFAERATKISRPMKNASRSVQVIFDMIKDNDGLHWTYARDVLAKQGYAERTCSARLSELKSKYRLVERRADGLYYLTKLGYKTKVVPQ